MCSSSESISLKSHRNITTQTFIAYTPGQTSIIYEKIVWISLKKMYGEYLFPLEKYFCHFHYLALKNMYLLVCRLDLWRYELQCWLQLFYLCSFFFSKVTPTNLVLSFFHTGSRKGIIGNLWVLLKPTCSLNQCGRGSSQFLGRHRWVSFFLLVFVSAARGFYWVPRFSPLLKTNIPNSNSLWKVSPAGRGS